MQNIVKESWKLTQNLAHFSFICILIPPKKKEYTYFEKLHTFDFQVLRWVSMYFIFFVRNFSLTTSCKLPEAGIWSYVFLQCEAPALSWRKLLLGKKKYNLFLLLFIDQFSKQNRHHLQKDLDFFFSFCSITVLILFLIV